MLDSLLKAALIDKINLHFKCGGEGFSGIPIKLDDSFVLVCRLRSELSPPGIDHWLLRLDSIDSICTMQDIWDQDRLDCMFNIT